MKYSLDAKNPAWLLVIWLDAEDGHCWIQLIDRTLISWNDRVFELMDERGMETYDTLQLFDAVADAAVQEFGAEDGLTYDEAVAIVREHAAAPSEGKFCLRSGCVLMH